MEAFPAQVRWRVGLSHQLSQLHVGQAAWVQGPRPVDTIVFQRSLSILHGFATVNAFFLIIFLLFHHDLGRL